MCVKLIGMVTGEQRSTAVAQGPAGVDFFISYTAADEAWATWVGEVLESQVWPDGRRVRVKVQAWDSPMGENFVVWISAQLAAAGRTIALCSPAYFDSHWCTQEWTGALNGRKITPLRVADIGLPPVLATIGYRDLHGVDEVTARRRLLEAVGLAAAARRSSGFPGSRATDVSTGAAFPGRLPTVFTAPSRLRHFTGRQPLLEKIRTSLASDGGGRRVAVTALHGLGGVGKTQLAVEYAHRHAADYQLVLWVDAEQTPLIAVQLAALAGRLSLPASGQVVEDAAAVVEALRRRGGAGCWSSTTPRTQRRCAPGCRTASAIF